MVKDSSPIYNLYFLCLTLIATVALMTSCGAGGAATPSVTPQAQAAAASLSPQVLTIPGMPVGTTSAPQSVTLSNSGNSALSVSNITISGTNAAEFAQSNNCG